jgi:hypothetical protein
MAIHPEFRIREVTDAIFDSNLFRSGAPRKKSLFRLMRVHLNVPGFGWAACLLQSFFSLASSTGVDEQPSRSGREQRPALWLSYEVYD